MHEEWRQGELVISTDRERLDLKTIHRCLSEESYWALGRPLPLVEKALRNSLCFGIYRDAEQVGFARVVTDYATFAWVADVFILPDWRGRGLSKWMMGVITGHPSLQGLRRWILSTRDAHGLYQQFGFTPLKNPAGFMEKFTEAPIS